MSTVTKGRGGRPPRAKGEKLQRTSFSLRPSAALALELLAREQHRSQSQVVEALVLAECRKVEIAGSEVYKTLAELVEAVANMHEAHRTRVIAEHAPMFLPYGYRLIGDHMLKARAKIIDSDQYDDREKAAHLETFDQWCIDQWAGLKAHAEDTGRNMRLDEMTAWPEAKGDPDASWDY